MTQELIDPLIAQTADGTCAKDLFLYLKTIPEEQLSEDLIIEQLDSKYKDRIKSYKCLQHNNAEDWTVIIIFTDASAFKLKVVKAIDDPNCDDIEMSYGLYFSKELSPKMVRH